jgi:aldehyde dehydrogenase
LAKIETVDNGKAVRESMAADLPLVVDQFRYFAGVIRAEEGSASEIDENTLSLCIQEPLGVVGQIIPWNFPLLMAAWKIAPALAAGNCVVVKPAEQTPTSIMVLMDLIKDVVPPGVINVVTGYGIEAGSALATSKGINKIGFTGSTATGTFVLQAAADNLIPATMELGGKSPNIFFSSIADKVNLLTLRICLRNCLSVVSVRSVSLRQVSLRCVCGTRRTTRCWTRRWRAPCSSPSTRARSVRASPAF